MIYYVKNGPRITQYSKRLTVFFSAYKFGTNNEKQEHLEVLLPWL